MDKKLFAELTQSLNEMDDIVNGVATPAREFHVDAEGVRDIRAITKLSQAKFAKLLHIDVGTLRNWEQDRRQPTGPAKALLHAIKNDPISVLQALSK